MVHFGSSVSPKCTFYCAAHAANERKPSVAQDRCSLVQHPLVDESQQEKITHWEANRRVASQCDAEMWNNKDLSTIKSGNSDYRTAKHNKVRFSEVQSVFYYILICLCNCSSVMCCVSYWYILFFLLDFSKELSAVIWQLPRLTVWLSQKHPFRGLQHPSASLVRKQQRSHAQTGPTRHQRQHFGKMVLNKTELKNPVICKKKEKQPI